MTSSDCPRCHGTGWLRHRFYTDGKPCTCPAGVEAARFAALSPEAQQAEVAARVATERAAAKAARRARRAAGSAA